MKKTKCKKCKEQIKPKRGRSIRVQLALIVLGFFTLGVGWLILMIYDMIKPKYSCPKCGKTLKIAS